MGEGNGSHSQLQKRFCAQDAPEYNCGRNMSVPSNEPRLSVVCLPLKRPDPKLSLRRECSG